MRASRLTAGKLVTLDPGAVAVVSPADPAAIVTALPSGRTLYRGDQAGEAARAFIEFPDFGDPGLNNAAGPICLVLAPFAATYHALSAGGAEVPAAALSEMETALATGLREAAQQRHLRNCLRDTVEATGPGGAVSPDSGGLCSWEGETPGTILESAVEELRLERTGSSDASFALTIRARVRTLRARDAAVLDEQQLQYQSGPALLLDWAGPDVLKNVAATGYRELARKAVSGFRTTTAQSPVLVGAGFKRPSPHPRRSPVLLASTRPAWPQPALVQVVDYPVSVPETLDLQVLAKAPPLTLQRPLTKDEAAFQAMKNVEWSLDGMENSHNSVVQLTAIAIAVPWSVTSQFIAGLQGVRSGKLLQAEAELAAAARKPELQKHLATELAQQLAPRMTPPVILVSQPAQAGAAPDDTALGVDVISAALKGDGTVNPSLALCVEARATVFRPRDGSVLYSWPIEYRSKGRVFTHWAANDARLFREELKRCREQVATAIVEQVAARDLIRPENAKPPMLARAHE